MLNPAEQRRTSAELTDNLAAAGLTEAEVCADLGFDPARLRATTSVLAADPADVWLLRDYLVQAVRDVGADLTPFSVLTDASRRSAAGWFRLRPAPRHRFEA